MNFVKFWKLVEKHPWLPRVIDIIWDPIFYDDGPEADTCVMGEYLSPSFLTENIGWVVFRPWRKIGMEERGNLRKVVVSKYGRKHTLLVATSLQVFWHRENQKPFVEITLEEGENCLTTLRELIDRVHSSNGIVDAVVRTTLGDEESEPDVDTESNSPALYEDNIDKNDGNC